MWQYRTPPRVEDPERLSRFLDLLEGIDWHQDEKASLHTAFKALNDLIFHEVVYYYHSRKKQRRFSLLTRGTALMFGTLGVMLPILAGADPLRFQCVSPYGYPLLIAAGAAITINRMFGATGGHIRYVTAQLELERIITRFRVNWLQMMALRKNEKSEVTPEAFRLMNAFVDDAYRVIQEETVVWGQSISSALNEYEKNLLSREKSMDTRDKKEEL